MRCLLHGEEARVPLPAVARRVAETRQLLCDGLHPQIDVSVGSIRLSHVWRQPSRQERTPSWRAKFVAVVPVRC